MKSKANLKGHPLHPILIGFPIAFFVGTLIFDVLAYINKDSVYWQTGKLLEIAGIAGALLAAIPGAVDYFYTVPPKSSAKKRGALHGLLNIGMLLIYIIAYVLRRENSNILIIAMEASGVIILTISGWLGGTLVYRNQIGVDIRYADAGKWNEAYFDQKSGLIEVAAASEFKVDQMKLLHITGKRIVLGKTEKGYVAFDDQCTHKGGSLAGGMMICGTVQCPWHGSQFDVKTGVCKTGPASTGIGVYAIKEKDGKVYLDL